MNSEKQKIKIRTAITNYCNRAEKSQLKWHYTQQRPFHGFGVAPELVHYNDCSGYVSLVINWAMHETGIYLRDPLGESYNGTGYTGTLIDWLKSNGTKAPKDKYLVGDIAINGYSSSNTHHTFICKKGGTASTSQWSTNGNENAPNQVKLNYHPIPLVGVWRHPGLL